MKSKFSLLFLPLFLVSCTRVTTSSQSPISFSSTSENSSVETSSSKESSISSSSETISSSSSSDSSSSSETSPYSYKTGTLYEAAINETGTDYIPQEKGTLSYLVDPYYGEDRAFVSLSSFITTLVSQTCTITITEDKANYSFSGNMEDFSITKEAGLCTFSNLSAVGALGSVRHPQDLADTTKPGNPHTEIIQSTTTKPGYVSYSLSDHDIPYYFVNEDVYLPTSVIGCFFLYTLWSSMTFNGTNFYMVDDAGKLNGSDENHRTGFANHYYSTSTMKDTATKSEAVATLDANCFLFTIDTFYGFIDEEQFADGYGAYLKKEYPSLYNGIYSTDAETVMDSYDTIIRIVMGDGHSALYCRNGTTGSFYNEGKHEIDAETAHQSERVQTLLDTYSRLRTQRQEELGLESATNLGDKYLEMKGETAIIRFDAFVASHYPANQTDEFYETHRNNDLFSLFYTCYNKIEENGNIENVIVDVTCNGGGDSVALVAALGFMVKNPEITLYERTAQVGYSAIYRTDCNANGVFEDDESPAEKYNQYVLTSGYSFSCGNAFPYYAKVGGCKTIGVTSGGGGCAVYPLLLSDGYPVRISGPSTLGRTSVDGTIIDAGVTPDIEIPEADFYNIDKLTAAITAA